MRKEGKLWAGREVQAGSTEGEGKEDEREGVEEETQAKEGTSRKGEEGSGPREGKQIQALTSGSAMSLLDARVLWEDMGGGAEKQLLFVAIVIEKTEKTESSRLICCRVP